MYRITKETRNEVNVELKELRSNGQVELALNARKLFDTLKNKVWAEEPTTVQELIAQYNGQLSTLQQTLAGNVLLPVIMFEEVDVSLDLDTDELDEDTDRFNSRFDFINTKNIEDMNAKELALVLFKDMGTEVESSVLSMNAGLKVKLDLLDELKESLMEAHPTIRVELLQQKLANALALTKLDRGSSLVLKDGNLAVYDYLNDSRKVDSKNFMFLADMLGDKTQSLDILVLQSAFRSYKEEVAQGKLKPTSNELNLAIVRAISGVKPLTEDKKSLVKNIKFN